MVGGYLLGVARRSLGYMRLVRGYLLQLARLGMVEIGVGLGFPSRVSSPDSGVICPVGFFIYFPDTDLIHTHEAGACFAAGTGFSVSPTRFHVVCDVNLYLSFRLEGLNNLYGY